MVRLQPAKLQIVSSSLTFTSIRPVSLMEKISRYEREAVGSIPALGAKYKFDFFKKICYNIYTKIS